MQQSLFAMALPVEDALTPEIPVFSSQQPLDDTVFAVIDLETTGLNPKRNAITEITAIKFQQGRDLEMFSTLVQTHEPIPDELVRLTGISNEMLAGAPSLPTVLADLMTFLGPNPVMVGHNVPFDLGFLHEKLSQNGMGAMVQRMPLTRAFCTRVLALKSIPGLPNYQGMTVATACGVHNPNPHRAEADVRMSAGILFSIINRLRANGQAVHSVQDLLAYQGELKVR